MPTTITQSFGGTSEAAIAAFERKFRVPLPIDYREFLMEFNGGKPTPSTFNVPDLKQEVLVDWLYGIGLERHFSLESALEEFGDELSTGFLVIGHDPGANLLLLANTTLRKGIYYWDHTHFFPGSGKTRNTYLVANSFSDFLQNLK